MFLVKFQAVLWMKKHCMTLTSATQWMIVHVVMSNLIFWTEWMQSARIFQTVYLIVLIGHNKGYLACKIHSSSFTEHLDDAYKCGTWLSKWFCVFFYYYYYYYCCYVNFCSIQTSFESLNRSASQNCNLSIICPVIFLYLAVSVVHWLLV